MAFRCPVNTKACTDFIYPLTTLVCHERPWGGKGVEGDGRGGGGATWDSSCRSPECGGVRFRLLSVVRVRQGSHYGKRLEGALREAEEWAEERAAEGVTLVLAHSKDHRVCSARPLGRGWSRTPGGEPRGEETQLLLKWHVSLGRCTREWPGAAWERTGGARNCWERPGAPLERRGAPLERQVMEEGKCRGPCALICVAMCSVAM